jgi:hypothetical protein
MVAEGWVRIPENNHLPVVAKNHLPAEYGISNFFMKGYYEIY